MTRPGSPLQTTSVCVEFHVDLLSRNDKRGWRVPLAVEALAPCDPTDAVPVLADCNLAGSDFTAAEERTVYLDHGGRVLRSFADPYGHLEAARQKLPGPARRFPYFRRNNVDHEYIPDRHHAIDGMPIRMHPTVVHVPLDGAPSLADGELDTGPLQAAVEEARRLTASSLLLRSTGWFTSSALPKWMVYEYNGRKGVLLAERAMATIGGSFAIDRLEAAVAHGERLHGPGFQIVGAVRSLAVDRIPQASTDIVDLACRLAAVTSRHLAPHLGDLDPEKVRTWHEAHNVRELVATEGAAAAYRILAGCERLMSDHLWSKTQRHEHGWRSERMRVRNELEAALDARPQAPGMP
jgi:hypothetical protein